MQQFGTIVEHSDVGTGETVTFASGASFRCFGFTVGSEEASTDVEISDVDGNELFHFFLDARSSVIHNIPFFVDNGFRAAVTTGATAHVSVIRSQVGS